MELSTLLVNPFRQAAQPAVRERLRLTFDLRLGITIASVAERLPSYHLLTGDVRSAF